VVTAPQIDLAGPAFWSRPPRERLEAFRVLRGLATPVYFPERDGGFHALVRHSQVVQASRRPELFTSGTGVTTPRPARWVRTVFGDSMVNLDDPRHARLRGIVSRAFTPRVVARISADVEQVAAGIVDRLTTAGPADFVAAVAGPMPLQVICSMMGVPEDERQALLNRVDHAAAGSAARRRLRIPGRSLRGLAHLHAVMARVARQRRREPADDLITGLVTADVDGRRLGARELGAFFSLLMVAGVETTRNAIAHGLHLLTAHPAQRELLTGDFARYGDGFVDEVVRFSSPIVQFRRTVAADCELDGHPLRAGEDVVLFYASANRDEEVFADPDTFDLTRRPNPHVGFGGGGPHFCLGTSLARQEMTVLFRELFTRLPAIRSTREPELVPSSFDNRVRRLEFTF
jgi:cytochrome P450